MIDGGLKKNKINIPHSMVALLIALVIYTVMLAICKITPFGNNTWISYDMKRQYVDFYSFFRHILSGDNNLFYSFSTALGSGILGFIGYYLISPFLFIIALFPNTLMPLAISIVIGLKLALSAFTMDIFLQKYCGKGSYLCAISYSFCGFIIANSVNLMWIDVLILLPIVMLMTERLIEGEKLMGYIVSVAAILLLNYYISYMVLIFVLIWFFSRMLALKIKNPPQALFRLGMATVAAAGIDAILLIPTFIELKNNPRDLNELGLGLSYEPLTIKQLLSKLFSLSYDTAEIYWGAPMMFCGILIFVLLVLFFLNKKISLHERAAMLLLLLVFGLSFMNRQLNVIWHAGMEPSAYYYREAIMCVFVILVCASRSMQEIRNGISLTRYLMAVISLIAIMCYVFNRHVSYFNTFKIRLNIVIVIVILALLGLLIFAKKKILTTLACFLLVIVQFLELGVNAVYIYKIESQQQERAGGFASTVDSIEKTVAEVKKLDPSFYRMENWSPRQQNDGMMFLYNGVTHYSSAGLYNVRNMLKKLGYNDDGQYTDYGYDNTKTADSILGIKYLLTDASHAGRMHKDYELVVDGDIQAYRNPYALSTGIGVYREMSGESLDPFSFQEEIYTRLAGELIEIFEPAETSMQEIVSSRPEREYTVTAAMDGDMYFYISDIIDACDNMEIYLNDEFISYYGNNACLKVIHLGYMNKGDVVYVRIKTDDIDEFGNPLFVTENTKALARAYELVSSRCASIDKLSSSHIKMTIDSTYTVGDAISGEVGIFTSIPYEKGWKIKVAGTKVNAVEAYDSLIYIPVTEAIQQVELAPGENLEVEIIFVPEGFGLGLAVSLASVLLIILVARLRITEADYFEYEDEDDEESNIIQEENNQI